MSGTIAPVLPPPVWEGRRNETPFGHSTRRLPPLVKLAVAVVVLVVGGVIIKGLVTPGPPPRCVFTCDLPPSGIPEGTGVAFQSLKYGFSFDYPSGPLFGLAKTQQANGAGVANLAYEGQNGQFLGWVLVAAGNGRQQLSSLISEEAQTLSGSIQNIQETGPIMGAEIGFQAGEGQFYSGTYSEADGNTLDLDFGIVAVQRGNLWAYVVGISTVDAGSSGALLYPDFDYILDRWRWAG